MTTSQLDVPVLIVVSDVAAKRCGAGWFPAQHAVQARERGKPLRLTVLEPLTPALLNLARDLPQGRFAADGTLALDLVDREVIDRLLTLAGGKASAGEPPATKPGSSGEGAAKSELASTAKPLVAGAGVKAPLKEAGLATGGAARPAASARQGDGGASPAAKPQAAPSPVTKAGSPSPAVAATNMTELVDELWSKVAIGSLVIAPDLDRDEGWWEAIVVDKRGHSLTLRWRDFEELGLITRKLRDVALMHPKSGIR